LQVRSVALTAAIGVAAWVFKQLRAFADVKLPFSIDDHSPNNYLRASRAEIGSEWFGDLGIGAALAPSEHPLRAPAEPEPAPTAH
jgi:hypothetical protein